MLDATTPPLRADARRNRHRLLAAAELVVARDGANASLEEIARQAGVGSATLHRHFSSRQAMLEELFHKRVDVLCGHAEQLASSADPMASLLEWLRAVGQYVTSTRGFAESMRPPDDISCSSTANSCFARTAAAGSQLLDRAHAAGVVRADVNIAELLTLINAISLVSGNGADSAATVDRLLLLAVYGIRRPGL